MSVTTNIAGIGVKRKLKMALCGTVSSFLASKMVEVGRIPAQGLSACFLLSKFLSENVENN